MTAGHHDLLVYKIFKHRACSRNSRAKIEEIAHKTTQKEQDRSRVRGVGVFVCYNGGHGVHIHVRAYTLQRKDGSINCEGKTRTI